MNAETPAPFSPPAFITGVLSDAVALQQPLGTTLLRRLRGG